MGRSQGMKYRLMSVGSSLAWALLATVWALIAAEAVQAFWGAPLSPVVWRAVTVCWGTAFTLEAAGEHLVMRRRGWAMVAMTVGAHVVACGALAWWLHGMGVRLEGFPVLRCAGLIGLWLLALRAWLNFATERQGAGAGAECLRMLVLPGAVALAAWPFFTANFTGGVDARWYAYMLHDYLQQVHAGVFPVLLGQGEFAFNGALHPFRFAPYFQNLAGLLDWLTLRTLGTFALQHLTVVVSGGAAAFTAYLSLLGLAPQRRWTACLVAAAYVLNPAFWGLISMSDAAMSFMTMPWLPVLFYGVMRIIERRDVVGYVLVAAVLSILWTCHPPVALWSMLATLAMLGLAWLANGCRWRDALALGGCLALFGGLSAFHFQGVLEITPIGREPPPSTGYLMGSAVWLGLWAGLYYILCRRWKLPEGEARAGVTALQLAGAGLVSLAVMAVVRGFLPFEVHEAITKTLGFVRALWPGIILPVSPQVEHVSDIQPGYALLLLGLMGVIAACRARELGLVLPAAASVAFALLLLPVPAITRFLWGHMPMSILTTTSVAVSLRLTPVWGAVMAFGGGLALAWLAGKNPWEHRAAMTLLVGAVLWAGCEVQKIARLTHRLADPLISLTDRSKDMLRTENAQLFIYSYNFTYLPSYFSHGVVDYHLESRVLDRVTGEPNPDLAIHRTPPPGGSATLTWQYNPADPKWLLLTPTLPLEAGQRLIARFEFAAPEPQGALDISGLHFHREYLLPASGAGRGFGAQPGNSRELSLWNTSGVSYPLTFRFFPIPPLHPVEGPQFFARLEWQIVPDEALPVQTVSLIPSYRAKVDAKVSALLETPRVFIHGYVATRNGRPVEVVRSRENRVAVLLEPGPNEIALRFIGTPGLHRAAWVSLVCWLGIGFWGVAKIARTARA